MVYAGGSRFLLALDAASGDPLWSFDTGGLLLGSPLVVDEMVYFGSGDGWV